MVVVNTYAHKILISKALWLARFNEESPFYLPPAPLSTYGMSHPASKCKKVKVKVGFLYIALLTW